MTVINLRWVVDVHLLDGLCHLTPANLVTMLHRGQEWRDTKRQLDLAFADPRHFKVHDAVPASFGDEGAANHMRFCEGHGSPGVEAFVTRRDPRGDAEGALWPEQAITLEEAIEIYTMHGARAMKMEDRTGSIEAGKLADFIVLERNIFDIPIDEVADTKVQQTYFEGRLVYEKN